MIVATLCVLYIVGLLVGLVTFDAENEGYDSGWVVAQALFWPITLPLLLVSRMVR